MRPKLSPSARSCCTIASCSGVIVLVLPPLRPESDSCAVALRGAGIVGSSAARMPAMSALLRTVMPAAAYLR